MDPDLISKLQGFQLVTEEEHGFVVSHSDFRLSHEICTRSLIGKIYGNKVANFTGLKTILTSIWHPVSSFKIRELGVNVYQFIFDNQADKIQILNGIAWSFDSQFLILKPWVEGTDFLQERFHKIHLWVQIWNLPTHWLSAEIGFKFSNIFGAVLDVLIPEGGSKNGCHLKILTEVDLNKPLLRGTKLRFQSQTVWVNFKYEKLASFCFYCGRVGHMEKSCSIRIDAAKSGTVQTGQYGPWLRADNVRPNPKSSPPSRPHSVPPHTSQALSSVLPHVVTSSAPPTTDPTPPPAPPLPYHPPSSSLQASSLSVPLRPSRCIPNYPLLPLLLFIPHPFMFPQSPLQILFSRVFDHRPSRKSRRLIFHPP